MNGARWLSFKSRQSRRCSTHCSSDHRLLMQWRRLPARDFVDALISAPLVLPPTVLGYYLLVALGHDSAIGDAWKAVFGRRIVFNFEGAVIAAAFGSLPLVVRAASGPVGRPNLINAARARRIAPARTVHVVLPLAGQGSRPAR
jgi:molybdate transport system permease protein